LIAQLATPRGFFIHQNFSWTKLQTLGKANSTKIQTLGRANSTKIQTLGRLHDKQNLLNI